MVVEPPAGPTDPATGPVPEADGTGPAPAAVQADGDPAAHDDGDAPGGRALPGHPELEATDLLVEELAVYGPPGRTGRRPPPAEWGPWVTFPPGSHTRRLIAGAVRSLGAEFRVEAESHQPEVLRQLVNLGLGWTVLPVFQAETEPHPLARARAAPLLTRRLVVVRRRSTPVDPVGRELIERLRATGRSVDDPGELSGPVGPTGRPRGGRATA